eukprot:TRINITY_DN2045_c0_g1_i2.p1 TRINITY_DN2045_c0_g1~~TRINITY_DN2045_c0_g1_i2.p1  ORF type:complete len:330 (-),score=44.81 TRINITY_DN2045_c0_g1_i2:419-1330(-)
MLREYWNQIPKVGKPLVTIVGIYSLFTAFSLIYGASVGCLGLITFACHSAFHCMSMIVGLVAVVVVKREKSFKFSFGFSRVDILASFSSCVLLTFACFFVVIEIAHQMFLSNDEEEDGSHENNLENHSNHVMKIAFIGIILDFICLYLLHKVMHSNMFRRTLTEFKWKSKKMVSKGTNLNFDALFLHLTSSIISIAGLAVSSWLKSKGHWLADPLISLGITGIIMYRVIPLFKVTARILLQASPNDTSLPVQRLLRKACSVDGVLECCSSHFWTLAPFHYVGSATFRVHNSSNEEVSGFKFPF